MDGTVLKHVTGVNGTLELLEDRIRIRRDGWTSRIYGRRHHEEFLYLSEIEHIELKKTAGGLAGYIAFNGGSDPDALEDLCISFLMPHEKHFTEMHQAIEAQREQYMASPQYIKTHEFAFDR
jgi:hypothetical protein